jgi:hypothetical protein
MVGRPYRLVPSLGMAAGLLLACAQEHGQQNGAKPALDAAGPSAAESGSAAPAKPRPQVKPGRSGVPGTKAVAMLEPLKAAVDEFSDRGRATFNVTEAGVDLTVLIRDCAPNGRAQVYIFEGSDCTSATLAGPRWDAPRGEGIPLLTCFGAGGQARLAWTRSNDDSKPWSIATGEDSDVLMHAVAVFDVATGEPMACGVIQLDESQPPPTEPTAGATEVSLLGRAQIAGLCFGGLFVRTNEHQCPDPKELTECAQVHCPLDACVARCGDYLACTTKEKDPCSVAYTCPVDDACAQCQGDVTQCVFMFCTDEIACAAPVTPDGPCSKLKACCDLQGDKADSCLEAVKVLEQLSGDPSCNGAMHDWDFFSHLPVPCMFQ